MTHPRMYSTESTDSDGYYRSLSSIEYFRTFTLRKALLYGVSALYVAIVSFAAIAEPFTALPCDNDHHTVKSDQPYYDGNPCRQTRHHNLLWLTRDECSYGRRLLAAALLGALIGWERRNADRPAGIRTMALVSLGSSLFTICSAFAFNTSPQNWDASRISAAIPSGVGFLGAGLIFKENTSTDNGPGASHVVHGLTTAASLWLSAAVGIACGGELFFSASFGTAIMLLLLRFGPRNSNLADEQDETDVEYIENEYQSTLNREMEAFITKPDKKNKAKGMTRSRSQIASVL